MTQTTPSGGPRVSTIPMLGMVYMYSLIFHLAMPALLHFLTRAGGSSSLVEELRSPLWNPWPSSPFSAAYLIAWGVAIAALTAAMILPRRILASGSLLRPSATSSAITPTRIAGSFLVRVGLLEIVSLSGFVFAFFSKAPGLSLPFCALGFFITLLLPPTHRHLTRFVGSVTAVLAVIMVVGACVTIPETGRSQLVAVPDSYMTEIGEKAFEEMKAKEKVSHNGTVNDEIRMIGERIARASEKSYDWQFVVFDSKEVNAFCLPGGKVGVYTGILPVAKTNAGLAAVLGHEVAHAVARHGAERATHSLIVAGTLLSVEKVIEDPKYRQLAMAALGVGFQFGFVLPFSRSHETEADNIGLVYMARAGYDPREAVALWQRMAETGSRPPEWLSTHPDPSRRAKDLEAHMAKAQEIYAKSQKIPTVPLL